MAPYFADIAQELLQLRAVNAQELRRIAERLGERVTECPAGVFEFSDGRVLFDDKERIILCPMSGAEDAPAGQQRPWLRREFETIASGFAQVLGEPNDSFTWGTDGWMCSLWRGSRVVLSVEESFYDTAYGAPGLVVACVDADDEAPKRREGLTARLFPERLARRPGPEPLNS